MLIKLMERNMLKRFVRRFIRFSVNGIEIVVFLNRLVMLLSSIVVNCVFVNGVLIY